MAARWCFPFLFFAVYGRRVSECSILNYCNQQMYHVNVNIHGTNKVLCIDVPHLMNGTTFEEIQKGVNATMQTRSILTQDKHAMYVVNCDSLGYIALIKNYDARRCQCYRAEQNTNDIILKPCDLTGTSQDMLLDFIGTIIQQGQWKSSLILTDGLRPVWKRKGMQLEAEVHGCNTSITNMKRAIKSFEKFNDYMNIIVDCEENLMYKILGEIEAIRSSTINFNWLIYGLSRNRHSLLKHMMEGDNAVILETSSRDISLDELLQDKTSGLVGVDVFWCFLDCNSKKSPSHIGTFTNPRDILGLPFILLPEEFTQFHGRHLEIAFMIYKPFVYSKVVNGRRQYVGIEVDMIQAMSNKFNFSYSFVESMDGWGNEKEDGSWDGMVGMVKREEADIGISGITISIAREKVIDFLFPHWEDASAVLFNLKSNRWYFFLQTFSLPMWLAILSMPWVIATVLITMKHVVDTHSPAKNAQTVSHTNKDNSNKTLTQPSRRISVKRPSVVFNNNARAESLSLRSHSSSIMSRKSSNKSHGGSIMKTRERGSVKTQNVEATINEETPRTETDLSKCVDIGIQENGQMEMKHERCRKMISYMYDYVFTLYGSILYQGMELPVKNMSIRIVMATFWFTMIILMGTYSGSLTATLMIRKNHMPYSNLEQLSKDNKYVVQMLKGTFREHLFKNSSKQVYRNMWTKLQSNPSESMIVNETVGLEKVLRLQGYAILSDKTKLEELVKTHRNCDVIFMKEEFFKSGYAMIVRQGAPYRRQFDNFIIHLFEAGLFKHWAETHMARDHCSHATAETHSEAVTLNDLTLLFLFVLGLGLGVAAVTLALECALNNLLRSRHRGQYFFKD